MDLTPGTRIGPYEVVSSLGAGGMGEVYRARDTRLKRQVALKILPESFATDPDRLARFQREAEVLASLNHTNIAQIYGLEDSDPSTGSGQAALRALAMELVEGPTLADRIAQGPIPVDEALRIAKQIAEGLEAAHEQGIIHRDLKPANIKLRSDGVVKVLDFGLAKLADTTSPATSSPLLSNSPTITSPVMMTGVGMLLGTAAYMSPEQAKGLRADHRSDIFSFGSVLYEMLTGRQPFQGDSAPDVLASVLAREPDFTALPSNLDPRLANLLRRCLDKTPKRRWQAIGDLRVDLEAIAATSESTPTGSGGVTRTDQTYAHAQFDARLTAAAVAAKAALRRAWLSGAIATVATSALVGAGVWWTTRPPGARVTRLTITSPASATLSVNGVDRDLAITPDGSRVIYMSGTQVFVRALDALEPTLVFRGAPRGAFVSPDSQWFGFVDSGNSLRKMAITGGPSVILATLDAPPRGATWISDGTIVFATSALGTGLHRVSEAGGATSVLTRPDRAQAELDHLWPEALPEGRGVLFTIVTTGNAPSEATVAVLDLRTGTQKVLVRGGSHAHYVASGHLIYAAAGTLLAVAFDLDRLETRGTPVPVVPQVVTTIQGAVDAVVSAQGTLAYVAGGTGSVLQRSLVWVDRQGQETPIAAPPRAYVYPRLAPDGARVALYAQDQEQDIWLWDLVRSTLTRLTFDPIIDTHHVWTPDGQRLIFSSERGGARNLYWQSADGTGAVERLTESPNQQNATTVTPDGTRLVFYEATPSGGNDIMQLQLEADHRVTPLIQTPFAEQNPAISPDGRWLLYEANDSGQFEVYVRPYPEINSGKWQVSSGGGTRPLWARNGQELFYVSLTGALMRVGVERGPSWAATPPSMIVREGYFTVPGGNPGRTYDISPDGRRFLVIKNATTDAGAAPPGIVVVQHFDEELKRLVPN